VPDPIIGILRAFDVDLDRDDVAVQVGPERDAGWGGVAAETMIRQKGRSSQLSSG